MKLTEKLIDSVISEAIGEDILPMIKLLKGKKHISEIKLAGKLKIDINQVRNMLYRLHNMNLVSFIKKKDEKENWYAYHWMLDLSKVKYLAYSVKRSYVDRLKDRLKRETSDHFFCCQNKCIRLSFDQATEFEYKCPECGTLMYQDENIKEIEKIRVNIKELEFELRP